jgi:hypothetical protein
MRNGECAVIMKTLMVERLGLAGRDFIREEITIKIFVYQGVFIEICLQGLAGRGRARVAPVEMPPSTSRVWPVM